MARLVLSQGGLSLVIFMMLLVGGSRSDGRAESVVALALNGKNNFVEISPGLILGPRFTEEAWILPEVHDTNYHGFIGHPGSQLLRPPSLWVVNGTALHAGFGDGKKWHAFYSELDVLVPHVWNHVAATYDETTFRVFANGIEVISERIEAVPLPQTVTRVGKIENNALPGAIREVRFWNRARTPEEIRRNMTKQLRGTEEGLVAYFPLDDGAGNSVRNSVSRGSTGALRNGAHWITSAAAIAPAVFEPQLWGGRDGIAAHLPTGLDAAPTAAIEVIFRKSVKESDAQLIRLSIDNKAVKPEVTTMDDGVVEVRYQPTEAFEPGSKHTVKLSYVTSEPTRRTNDFSYSFSVSTSILLSK